MYSALFLPLKLRVIFYVCEREDVIKGELKENSCPVACLVAVLLLLVVKGLNSVYSQRMIFPVWLLSCRLQRIMPAFHFLTDEELMFYV